MLVSQLDYPLPPEAIAQTPLEPRDAARLLCLDRRTQRVQHRVIRDLPSLLRPDDLLVFNDTRVLRARLQGTRASGGKIEALLLKELQRNFWECLLKPGARLREGQEVQFVAPGLCVTAHLEKRLEESWLVRFSPEPEADLRDLLPRLGNVPLPPYIHETADEARYQTVYARHWEYQLAGPLDSAAAPTAGLHFTPELLARLRDCGIGLATVTLAVGPGTFRPVKAQVLEEHVMHTEEFYVPQEAAAAIAAQRAAGGRVVAVGTTTARALESAALPDGTVAPGAAATGIFITPGYRFQVVDALLTNFHLPRSTLLALVAALVQWPPRNAPEACHGDGLAVVKAAYATALSTGYRFFSFGDAMLIE